LLASNWGHSKFSLDLWKEDVAKITQSEGNLSLIMVWIDNQQGIVSNEVLKMLLKSGSPINHTDRDGGNMLWYANMRSTDLEGWKIMLDAGVKCNFIPQGRFGPQKTI